MASAMTPEPTVAMVRFARGDIAPEDSTGSRALRARLARPAQPASADARTKNRPVGVRSIPRKPARRSAASTMPGSCHVHGMPSAGRRPGRRWSSIDGQARRRAGAAGGATRRRRRGRRRAPGRAGTPRAAPSAPGSPGRGGTTHGSATWMCASSRWATSRSRARSSAAPSGSETWSSPLPAISGEKKPTPAAGSSIRPASGWSSSQRVTTSSSASQAVSWRAPRSNGAAAQEPVVGEGGRGRRGQDGPPARAATARGDGFGALGARRTAGGRRVPRSPRAGARAGTRCRRPCRGRSSTAAPSPRGRRGRGSIHGVPHHRQSKVARNDEGTGAASALVDARPGVGRRHAVERGRVEELGQDLDAVDDPRAGPREQARRRRPRTRARRGRRAGPPSRRAAASAPTRRSCRRGRTPQGIRTMTSGSTSPSASQVVSTDCAALVAQQLPAAGEAHLLGDPVADGERRVEPLDARRPAAARTRGPAARRRSRLDRLEPLPEPLDHVDAASSASVIAPTVWIALRIALDRRRLEATRPSRRRRGGARPR